MCVLNKLITKDRKYTLARQNIRQSAVEESWRRTSCCSSK